jgi:KUP system potassium uptake protein
MVAVIMTCFMTFWKWGMTKKRSYELDRRVRLRELLRREGETPKGETGEGAFFLGSGNGLPAEKSDISESITSPTYPKSDDMLFDSTSVNPMSNVPEEINSSPDSKLRRRTIFLRATDTPVARLPGVSIYYTSAPTSQSHAPHTFRHFLEHFPTLHSTCIFLHVRTAAQPHVPDEEKLMMEASPLWDGVWRGVYRVGYMEIPDFTASEFSSAIYEKLGRQENLTHVLQYTKLRARRRGTVKGVWPWIKSVPMQIRGYAIDVIWSGIDEVIGGIGKGWKVPVGDIVSVGDVAEV